MNLGSVFMTQSFHFTGTIIYRSHDSGLCLERQTLDCKVAGSILTWGGCCVLEQDTLSQLLSTGLTQEAVPK